MAKAVASITPSQIAEELDLTPLQVRVFLRNQDKGVGRGKRYKFTAKQADKLKKQLRAHYELDSDDE